jgi:aryl-alcohol dehydrogenase-like predicted oxidoreductase
MDHTTLGRTGLRVSVMGLGCGGPSRVGQSYGKSEEHSVEVVSAALAHGVTFFDTSEAYGTESILGRGLRGTPRDSVVVSTKMSPRDGDGPVPASRVRSALEGSLERLGLDYVDIYHVHGLAAKHYDHAVGEFVPELLKLRDEGKLRFMGVTEAFVPDPGHKMLQRAVQDDCWDVVMVGFNMLNQSARDRVLAAARAKDIGVLVMFAVRRALSDPARLQGLLADLRQRGLVHAETPGEGSGLDFLVRDGGATSLQDAAYRFCRHEPGVHVILSGTGNLSHLESNVVSLGRGPLPPEDVARLREMFARVDDVSGN